LGVYDYAYRDKESCQSLCVNIKVLAPSILAFPVIVTLLAVEAVIGTE
jgi:hypothetical protein